MVFNGTSWYGSKNRTTMANITLTNAKGEDVSKASGKQGNGPQVMSKPDPKKQPQVITPPKNEAPPGITAPKTEEKAEEKAPTPEELDEQRRLFSEKMFGSSPKREKKEKAPETTEKPAETKPPEAAAKPEDKKPEPKEAPKDEPKAKAKPEPEADDEPFRSKAEPEAPKPNVKGKPTMMDRKESTAVEGLTLTKGQELFLNDLKELERTMPEQYRNAVKEQTDFWKLREKYIQDWEKVHPEEDFDPKSEEHARFYNKHEPDIDPDDLEVARRTLVINEAEERAFKRTSSNQSLEKTEREMKEASPRIKQEAQTNMFKMVEIAAPDVFEALKTDAKAAQDTYELELDVLNKYGEVVQEVVYEMQYLLEFGDHYQPDVAKRTKLPSGLVIYPHAELLDFAKELQADIAAMPADQTERDGKKFMPSGEFYERLKTIHEADMEPNRKAAAERDLKAKYWIIDREGIRKSFVKHQAEMAEKEITKLRRLADKRSGKTPKSEELKDDSKKGEDAQTTDEPGSKGRKPTPPASLSAFDKSNPSDIGSAKGAESSKLFRQKMGW